MYYFILIFLLYYIFFYIILYFYLFFYKLLPLRHLCFTMRVVPSIYTDSLVPLFYPEFFVGS